MMQVPTYVKHENLKSWVEEMVELCRPDQVHWCDGSTEEYDQMCQLLVKSGTFTKLNEQK
ncbi:MAG TPA: hypothetical protein VEC93_19115, partial [Anaerolineae bacterium]|nr:hypothetical protein [Anaerolineae bacterium]